MDKGTVMYGKWCKSILTQFGWESLNELFNFINTIPDRKFLDNNLPNKHVFTKNMRYSINNIERDGYFLQDAKDMVEPGAIMEQLVYEYRNVRTRYIRYRKDLKIQLGIINKILATQ